MLPLPHGHWARRAIAQLRLNDNEMVLGGLAGGVHPAWYAALFACERVTGIEPALSAWENLPPPVVRAPGTFCHVVAFDLC